MGRLAFFEPETFTLPLSGLPPFITRKSELDDVMFFIFLDNGVIYQNAFILLHVVVGSSEYIKIILSSSTTFG
jgi:hypothetical protein